MADRIGRFARIVAGGAAFEPPHPLTEHGGMRRS